MIKPNESTQCQSGLLTLYVVFYSYTLCTMYALYIATCVCGFAHIIFNFIEVKVESPNFHVFSGSENYIKSLAGL